MGQNTWALSFERPLTLIPIFDKRISGWPVIISQSLSKCLYYPLSNKRGFCARLSHPYILRVLSYHNKLAMYQNKLAVQAQSLVYRIVRCARLRVSERKVSGGLLVKSRK